jgi:hypothetical protein
MGHLTLLALIPAAPRPSFPQFFKLSSMKSIEISRDSFSFSKVVVLARFPTESLDSLAVLSGSHCVDGEAHRGAAGGAMLGAAARAPAASAPPACAR